MRILKESNFLLCKFYLILHEVLLAFSTSRNKQTCKADEEICSQTLVPRRVVELSHRPGAMLCQPTLRQLQSLRTSSIIFRHKNCVHHIQLWEYGPYRVSKSISRPVGIVKMSCWSPAQTGRIVQAGQGVQAHLVQIPAWSKVMSQPQSSNLLQCCGSTSSFGYWGTTETLCVGHNIRINIICSSFYDWWEAKCKLYFFCCSSVTYALKDHLWWEVGMYCE